MSFIPRAHFPYPSHTPSWFAGHMARSLRNLPALLEDIDLVIEARDARLPLTSINSAFDSVLEKVWGFLRADRLGDIKGKGRELPAVGVSRGRGKLVVYTKRDLADARYEEPLKKAFMQHLGQKVLFADTRVDKDVREILRHAVRIAKDNNDTMPEMKILVVGMPNVGKSSLLNALRRVGVHKGKAFRTGAEAGITRKLTGTVKIHENPSIYVYDTPGVMIPFLGKGEEGAERGLKLALTAGIKESLFEQDTVVDYLLWRMNKKLATEQHLHQHDPARNPTYLDLLPLPTRFTYPTENLLDLLNALADRMGALRKGGERDIDAARTYILKAFREGKLGRWTLDEMDGGIKIASDVIDSPSSLVEGIQEFEGLGGESEGQRESRRLLDMVIGGLGAEDGVPAVNQGTGWSNAAQHESKEKEERFKEPTQTLTERTESPETPDTNANNPNTNSTTHNPSNPYQPQITSTQTQNLTALVSASLRIHLQSAKRAQEDSEKGLNLSNNQNKKLEIAAKLAEKRGKWKDKGIQGNLAAGKIVSGRKGKEIRYGSRGVKGGRGGRKA